jgi:hydroxyacylglutathione hydrolase
MNVEFVKEVVGFLEVNCYLVPSETDGCVYIIDPGASPDSIAEKAKSFGLDDYCILLTHAHIDHISALKELMDTLPVSRLYLHKDDILLYKSPANELPPLMPTVVNPPEPATEISSADFQVIETPGHTRGGVCYYFKNIPALFSGDTIFCSSIGRTDLPGGNSEILLKSIKEKLFVLPDDLKVYPGHGPFTTIGAEKTTNPFL